MDTIPGIETADYEVAEVDHSSVEGLAKLFDKAKVVGNMVGPFSNRGPEVAEACLAARVFHCAEHHGPPGDWVADARGTEIESSPPRACCSLPASRANVHSRRDRRRIFASRTPGVDTLDILVLWKGFPTYASHPRQSSRSCRPNGIISRINSSNGRKTLISTSPVPGQHAQPLVTP